MSPYLFPRPKGFRPSDLATIVEFSDGLEFFNGNPRLKGNAGRGMKYERQTHQHLMERFPPLPSSPMYLPSRWIRFRTSDPRERDWRWAQPDGLLLDLDRSLVTIIEVKLRHNQGAWWGLRRLYEPLIRKMFGPRWSFAVCEVCRWYDPAVPWPEPFTLVRNPAALKPGEFGVHILTDLGIKRDAALRLATFPGFLG